MGLLAGLALGQTVSSLVFGITVHDPATFIGVGLILTMVALAACIVPACKAACLDPVVALRE